MAQLNSRKYTELHCSTLTVVNKTSLEYTFSGGGVHWTDWTLPRIHVYGNQAPFCKHVTRVWSNFSGTSHCAHRTVVCSLHTVWVKNCGKWVGDSVQISKMTKSQAILALYCTLPHFTEHYCSGIYCQGTSLACTTAIGFVCQFVGQFISHNRHISLPTVYIIHKLYRTIYSICCYTVNKSHTVNYRILTRKQLSVFLLLGY